MWWDIAPGEDAEFHEWHTREHFPERLGVPGFLRGRRYVAEQGEPRYFTLYELDSLGVMTSPAYLARLNDPTDWTRRVIPTFRNLNRTASRVTLSLGRGIGGTLATLRLEPRLGREDELRRWLTDTTLPALLEQPQMVGVHLCEAEVEASRVQTEERRLREREDEVARWVVLAEGGEPAAAADAFQRLLKPDDLEQYGAEPGAVLGIYRLLYSLSAESSGAGRAVR